MEVVKCKKNLYKISSDGGNPKSQFTDDLVSGTQDISNVDRIILSFLEHFKSFLFKFRPTDRFEATGWKTQRRGGNSSKGSFGPSQERSHDESMEEQSGMDVFDQSWEGKWRATAHEDSFGTVGSNLEPGRLGKIL
ncbi:predicted protein [Histoplasma capsulatum H143]|uniref:Uncharacterized protein n=1 Tax=Ajellomyces capsulatus (strain H143) TaxID=544712 RepID=C6HBL1_AJECH|nr:predicted protein [Histoplasma capsulatum H143]